MSIIREPGCSGSNDVNIAARSSEPSIHDETSPGLADLTDVIGVEDPDDGAVIEAEIIVWTAKASLQAVVVYHQR